ncbi:hypothetical protein Mth01_06350 [Sphaerimonospora thailandensis]|uniref:Uncharacterized protein n=1 Tax=Sphaerimonospora thailandensis TaxID=795644 RepID=A0A8J3R6Q2_9ACTN|nr:hypothetical protein Mth01_06350 [Sphaerimonospora thailandensis]
MSLQDLRPQYGNSWAAWSDSHRSTTRRCRFPADVLNKTDLAMTVNASTLTDVAVRIEEQTRLATEHLEQA